MNELKSDIVRFYVSSTTAFKLTRVGSGFEWVNEDGTPVRPQLKVIWNGETGELKSAEVLK